MLAASFVPCRAAVARPEPEPVAAVPARAAECLRTGKAAVLAEWERRVRDDSPAARGASPHVLLHSLPRFLDVMIASLERGRAEAVSTTDVAVADCDLRQVLATRDVRADAAPRRVSWIGGHANSARRLPENQRGLRFLPPMPRKSKFSEAEIIRAVQQVEGGTSPSEVSRAMGVSPQTMLRWRAKYGGMNVSEAQEKKRLEDENRKLRQLVAQQALDIAVLKEVVGKPFRRRWPRKSRTRRAERPSCTYARMRAAAGAVENASSRSGYRHVVRPPRCRPH